MEKSIDAGKNTVSQPAWLTIFRIALGAILIWKGINFIHDTARLKSLIEQTGIGFFSQNAAALTLVVTILTFLCGFFIAVGLYTRLACIIQLPIVIVAVYVLTSRHLQQDNFEWVLTVVVLLLLILFIIKSSGKLSADEYFRWGAALDRSS